MGGTITISYIMRILVMLSMYHDSFNVKFVEEIIGKIILGPLNLPLIVIPMNLNLNRETRAFEHNVQIRCTLEWC